MKKLFVLITSLFFLPLTLQAAPLDAEQQQQVRELVGKTLVENPDILVEAINKLQRREAATKEQEQKTALNARYKDLFENPADPSRGPAKDKAKLTMVYFADFNCGFCKRQDPVLEKLAKEFPDLRIIYKELPILGESSREAASMALAVHHNTPEKYLQVQERLMSKPGPHDSASIAAALKAEGLDAETVKKQVNDKITQQLENNVRLAAELGIRGTPALIFPDQIIGGYTAEQPLTAMIKERLKQP